MVPGYLPKKQLTTHILHTQGSDSWFTFVEHARNNYQCLPVVSARLLSPHYNVTLHTQTTGNSNSQCKKSPWGQHEAISRSSLVCQVCQHEAQSLSHLLEQTRDHIHRRDTRSQHIQLAAKLGDRPECSVLPLLCGRGHDRSSQQHARGSRSEAPTQEKGERAEGAEQRGGRGAARDSLGKASPQERARNQRVANVRDSGLHPSQKKQRHSSLDQVGLRRVRSPHLECFHRGAAEHRVLSVTAWVGLVRTTMSAPTLPKQVQASLRVHRDSTDTSELTEGVKLVKTRKAWGQNTVKLLLCVGPNLHAQQLFLSAAVETCGSKLKRGVGWRMASKNSWRLWKIGVHNLGACWVFGLLCHCTSECSLRRRITAAFFSVVVVQIVLSLVVPMSIFVALGVLFFSTTGALELTTATWDVETSDKTVFARPDWDKSMVQGNSGDRAATSVVASTFFPFLHCTRSLCVNCLVFVFSRPWSMVILVLWRITVAPVSALELTTATCKAETSGKTVFVKPDWDNLMEQWNRSNCAATSRCFGNFRLIAPAIL